MAVISLKRRTPGNPKPVVQANAQMPLMGHLEELRDRLIRCTIGIVIATAAAFAFIEPIMSIVLNLAGNHTVQAIDPTETFATYFRVALGVGVGFSMPILVYQLLRFLSPGLLPGEKRAVYISLPFIIVCFAAGAMFCYFVILPSALNFLLGFGDPRILKQISLTKFVGFVTNFILAIGVAFETPVLIFMLAKLNIASFERLSKFRKYAFLLSFLIAAMITPTPDPINQGIVAIPLFLLYELGVQLSRFARSKQPAEAV